MLDTASAGSAACSHVLDALLSRVSEQPRTVLAGGLGLFCALGCCGDSCVAIETTYRYTGLLIVPSSTRSGYRWAVGFSYCHPSSSHDQERHTHLKIIGGWDGVGVYAYGCVESYCSSTIALLLRVE